MFPESQDGFDASFHVYVERLCGTAVEDIARIGGGGNSQIFRIRTAKKTFAAKVYPPPTIDGRNRLDREFVALQFLKTKGLVQVPTPLGRDDDAGIGLYDWIDGDAIYAPGHIDIEIAAKFANVLLDLSKTPDAAGIDLAIESCLAVTDLFAQIEYRIDLLKEPAISNDDLRRYLETDLMPCYSHEQKTLRDAYEANGWDIAMPIDVPMRTLSPSDFGFHNALRRDDGELIFIDFEYFGWDDPVRLASDFVLHPGMQLGADLRELFLNRVLALFSTDPDFGKRLGLLFPLVGIRWCLIILNEFLNNHWARRALVNPSDNQLAAKHRQLEKAKQLLSSLETRKGEILRAI